MCLYGLRFGCGSEACFGFRLQFTEESAKDIAQFFPITRDQIPVIAFDLAKRRNFAALG